MSVHQEVLAMFDNLSGAGFDGFEDTAKLSTMNEDELISFLEHENEVGLEDNLGSSSYVPTEEAAREERMSEQELKELINLQARIEKGKEYMQNLYSTISNFFDAHEECKRWNETRKELTSITNAEKRLGTNMHALKAEFWEKNGELFRASKSAWESEGGSECSKAIKIKPRASEKLSGLFEEARGKYSKATWRKWFELELGEQLLMPYDTSTGDVHWSLAHLTEYERWYEVAELPVNRSQDEFENFKAMWRDV